MQLILPALGPTGREYLESVCRDTVTVREIPEILARDCSARVAQHFESWMCRPLSRAEERRMSAYYDGVLRGKVMRSRGSGLAPMRHRLVIRSLAEDLIEAGIPAKRIVSEIVESLHDAVSRAEVARILRDVEVGRAS